MRTSIHATLLGLAALLLFPAPIDAGMTSMREPLFRTADAARSRAEAQDAQILAPAGFAAAMDYYDRAEATFKRAGA